MATAPKIAFPFRGRWISVKTLAFLPKDGRGRSPGRKRANPRYRKGNDLFRPGLAAGPPVHGPAGPVSLKILHWRIFRALDAPEPLPSVAGEGLDNRVSRYSYCLLPELPPDKSEFHGNRKPASYYTRKPVGCKFFDNHYCL